MERERLSGLYEGMLREQKLLRLKGAGKGFGFYPSYLNGAVVPVDGGWTAR